MAFYGKYRAEVVDNNDPDKRGRIRVKCPSVLGEQISRWALPCFPPNTFTIPQAKELVWIEFEGGKKDSPIWNGVFYTKEQLTTKFKGITYDPKDVVLIAEDISNVASNEYSTKAGKNISEEAGVNINQNAGVSVVTISPAGHPITASVTTMSGNLSVAGQATDADGTMHSH